MYILGIIIALAYGYLIGSISNGVLIGYLFFKRDIRKEGSGNAGGTNVGRVLGKKWGLTCIVLDISKTVIAIWSTFWFFKIGAINEVFAFNTAKYDSASIFAYIAALGACLGHSFPLYFGFRGGKVVACLAGIVMASNWILILVGVGIFFIILFSTKFVSLSSIIGALSVGIFAFIPVTKYGMFGLLEYNIFYSLLVLIVSLYLVFRHKENIKRLIRHNERKVMWIKSFKHHK